MRRYLTYQEEIAEKDFFIAEKRLKEICREVSLRKLSITEFLYYCGIVDGYISPRTDYFLPYVRVMLNATVICYDIISEEMYNKCIEHLERILEEIINNKSDKDARLNGLKRR